MTAGIVKSGFLSTYAATELTLSSGTLTITQGFHTVTIDGTAAGTISNMPLEANTQADMGAYLPFLVLRAASGYTLYVNPLGTAVSEPIYTPDSAVGTITSTRAMLFVRNPPGSASGWLALY